MKYDVVEARYVRAHVVWLRFRDGRCGEIDLAQALRGEIMAPLKDPQFFSQFTIHPDFHTLVWPNGAGLRAGVPPRQHPRSRVGCSALPLMRGVERAPDP
jgi:hypothetical protein